MRGRTPCGVIVAGLIVGFGCGTALAESASSATMTVGGPAPLDPSTTTAVSSAAEAVPDPAALHLPRPPWSALSTTGTGTATPEPTMKISGSQTTTLRYQHYGALTPAASGFFQSGFSRHETTRLKASGQVLGVVKVDGELQQNDVDLDNRYVLTLASGGYELYLGEFPATFEGSEFSLFHRSVQGARLKGEWPVRNEPSATGIEFTVIGSAPRGSAQYEKFFGNDTQGPFPLAHAPVVIDSEQVLVDKTPLVRHVDYEVNALTGMLTMTKRIVERRSLVEVTYEARQTLYPRSTYGGQVNVKATPADTIGLIGVDERDRPDSGIRTASRVAPAAHSVLAATARHDGEYLRFGGEAAGSWVDQDVEARGVTAGGAYRGDAEVEQFGAKLGGDVKRTEPRFQSLGNTALGSDLLSWSAHGGYAPARWANFDAVHQERRTILGGDADHRVSSDVRTVVSPSAGSKASYRLYQSEDTLASSFDRQDRRHTADLEKAFGHVNVSGGYEHERLIDRDGSAPNQTWDAGRSGVQITGVPWMHATMSADVRQGRQSSSSMYGPSIPFTTSIVAANVGLTPRSGYALVADNHWQKTVGSAARNTIRTEARAAPLDQISGQGSFSDATLQMPYLGAVHDARMETTAGLLEMSPVRGVVVVVQPSLTETRLDGLSLPVNANRKEDYTGKWSGWAAISTEAGFSRDQFRLRDTASPSLPLLSRQDNDVWNVTTKLAPGRAMAVNVAFTERAGFRAQHDDSNPSGVDQKTTRQRTAKIGVKPQLELKLGVDAGYQYEAYDQRGTQGRASALPAYAVSPAVQQVQAFALQNDFTTVATRSHTANAGVSYQWLTSLISSASATYDIRQDPAKRLSDVETAGGSGGLTLRLKLIKLEGMYRFAQSRGGARTRQQAVSGSLDVIPADRIRWNTRVDVSMATNPVPVLTDVSTSLDVQF